MPGCIPSRPEATPQGGSFEISFALRDVRLNQKDETVPDDDPSQPWKLIGFDLDSYDTVPPAGSSSCTNMSRGFAPIDGVNGIDNVFGSLLGPALVVPSLEDDLCCFQSHGVGTLILHVTGWNGTRNDNAVSVSLLAASAGTKTPISMAQWSAALRGPEFVTMPLVPADFPSWMPGMDTYFIGSDEISTGNVDLGNNTDDGAYVVDGRVVMRPSATRPVRLYLGPRNSVVIPVSDAVIVAEMSSFVEADARGVGFTPPDSIEIGNAGGRIRGADLMDATIKLFGADLLSQSDCSSALSTTMQVFDQAADVLTNRADDGAPGDPTCEAVSFGVQFRGVRLAGLTVAGGNGVLRYFEPTCDESRPAMPDVPIPFLRDRCTYGSGTECSFPPTP